MKRVVMVSLFALAACGETARLSVADGQGPTPTLVAPNKTLFPTVNVADATGWPAWRFARAGVGRSFQRTNVLRDMTVAENVRLAAQIGCTPARRLLRPAATEAEPLRRATAALERAGLGSLARRDASILSHGQLRQLEIAMVLATDPQVLLLDEPLAGMGSEEAERIATLLRALARDHAVLLIEHDMDVVFAVADLLTVMVDGLVLDEGTPAHIRASAKVQDAYLGHAA